ncbi:MAG: hypothetical protein DDG60_06360 [Anaerolineae bacterium]|nr:MAG: hypothetical protein DDG60_06360 [Anaerolineae bacterium]
MQIQRLNLNLSVNIKFVETKQHKRSVCFVLPGLSRLNLGVQPWRYVVETAAQLYRLGHRVTILSESKPHALTGYNGVPVRSLRSVQQPFWRRNAELHKTIEVLKPDVLVWTLSLTDFLFQDYRAGGHQVQIGLLPYPLYAPRDLLRLGVKRWLTHWSFLHTHVLGALAPRWFLRLRAGQLGLHGYVTQTEITRWALYGVVQPCPVRVIRPGVDAAWLDTNAHVNGVRARLGLKHEDFVVLYFDSPAPLRGLPVLMDALERIHRQVPHLKLVAFNRRYLDEAHPTSESLETLVRQKDLTEVVRFVDGILEPEMLAEIARASDLTALPYELLPVDAPLTVLEALALRKPVLTSRLGALPELACLGRVYLAEPGDPDSVAQALLTAWHQERSADVVSPSGVVRGWEAVGAEWSAFLQSL